MRACFKTIKGKEGGRDKRREGKERGREGGYERRYECDRKLIYTCMDLSKNKLNGHNKN